MHDLVEKKISLISQAFGNWLTKINIIFDEIKVSLYKGRNRKNAYYLTGMHKYQRNTDSNLEFYIMELGEAGEAKYLILEVKYLMEVKHDLDALLF